MSIEAMKQALEALEKVKDMAWDADSAEGRDVLTALRTAIKQAEKQEPVALDAAPSNSLPTWSECNRIIENDEFRKRAEAGLEGQVLDTPRTTPVPTALHRFIHEYDCADSYRSAWFMHRLEQVLNEVTYPQPQQAEKQEPVANIRTWHKNGELHAELWNWDKGIEGLPDGEHDLYTTPQPATQDNAFEGLAKAVREFATEQRAIEAKLKEKMQ
jgi:hypothetical protein